MHFLGGENIPEVLTKVSHLFSMKQTELFTKTRKELPTDEVAKNAQLLIRAGFIYKEMAGVYAYLPLGVKVIEKINAIIREEMNAIGGQEITLPALQDPELWKATDRWSDETVDVWFKSKYAAGGEVGFGWTHEEVVTSLLKHYVSSHKDLPLYVYQIQNKFRNEIRAKSGIIRTREFAMKDLYSFSRTADEHQAFYDTCAEAYTRIFKRIGIGDKTYKTVASGGAFSKFSHEFQTLADAGEDTIYVSEEKQIAVNAEVFESVDFAELGIDPKKLKEQKSVEVGNIFSLGTRFSEALGLTYKNEAGENVPVIMGSYGIGPARAMGTSVELHADEKGIVWPESIAPYTVHVVELSGGDAEVKDYADGLYSMFTTAQVEVLYDDRDVRPGEKFNDSDLIGIPYRIVVSRKTKDEGTYEVVERRSGGISYLSEDELRRKFIAAEA